jgi:gamma-glutamyltranspeptidase/glutathione hydrolase
MSRYLYQQLPLSEAIGKGRWLLGRTWGSDQHDLKVEQDLYQVIGQDLASKGHQVRAVPENNELMGHAGAIVQHSTGHVQACSDPRSDGKGVVAE